jgi:hypothetical protein
MRKSTMEEDCVQQDSIMSEKRKLLDYGEASQRLRLLAFMKCFEIDLLITAL